MRQGQSDINQWFNEINYKAKHMEDQALLIENLFGKTTQYAKSSSELIKLKIIAQSANVVSTLTARLTIIVIFTLCFLIVNIGLALWIGEILGESFYGFFAVAGFYLLPGLLLLKYSDRWIKKPLQNFIIHHSLNTVSNEPD